MKEKSNTWHEIYSQPKIWQQTIQRFNDIQKDLGEYLSSVDFKRVLVIGCGSTYYLSQSVARLITQFSGIPASAAPSSDLYFFPQMRASEDTLLVAISRSATTTETIWAVEKFRNECGGPSVAITCYPELGISKQVDFVLSAPDAQEKSIAQTRSFSSMLLLGFGLASTLAGDPEIWEGVEQLPIQLDKVVDRLGGLCQEIGEKLEIDHYVFLGSGPMYGLANEAMLKTKEISLTFSEAYHTLELRHGPMSMVDDRTLVVGLLSDTGQAEQIAVLEDMKKLGAKTLALVEDVKMLSGIEPAYQIEMKSDIAEWVRIPLVLPVLQRIAYYRAQAKGLDPDNPTNLEAVVKLTRKSD